MHDTELKVPPQDLLAEQSVLASMMIEKGALEYAFEHLTADDFYEHKHRLMFKAMLAVSQRGDAVDQATVAGKLRDQEVIHEIGGGEYIVQICDLLNTAAHVDSYCRIVKEKAVLRAVIDGFTGVLRSCYRQEDEAVKLIEKAEQVIFEVSGKHERQGVSYVSEHVARVVEIIEATSAKKRSVTGIPSGFMALDKLTAGFHAGDLVILAARPGMGKTSLAMNIIEHVAIQEKVPTIFFSLEMSHEAILMRLISSMTGVGLYQLRTGFIGDGMDLVNQKAAEIYDAPLMLNESTSLTTTSLRSSARRVAGRLERQGKKLGLIVVDYLQLLHGPAGKRLDATQEVTEISRALKNVAVDLKVPVLALSQLSRATEEKGGKGRPKLSHLRQSGAIEQDADIVMFIYRPGMYTKNVSPEKRCETELLIEKHRNGPLGKIDMYFREEITKFEEMV